MSSTPKELPESPLTAESIDDDDGDSEQVMRMRIAERAYWISQSEDAGSDEENWLRAEQELRPGKGSSHAPMSHPPYAPES
jgi:hypothetical protein